MGCSAIADIGNVRPQMFHEIIFARRRDGQQFDLVNESCFVDRVIAMAIAIAIADRFQSIIAVVDHVASRFATVATYECRQYVRKQSVVGLRMNGCDSHVQESLCVCGYCIVLHYIALCYVMLCFMLCYVMLWKHKQGVS